MKPDPIEELFASDLQVANVGLPSFAESLRRAGGQVVQVDYRPPAGGDVSLARALDRLLEAQGERVAAANAEGLRRILAGKPVLEGIGKALDSIPGMAEDLILHAGPPVSWDRMSGPTRGAVIGALVYEGRAKTTEEAEELAASGDVRFEPCHHHSAVGPMAGVVSPSMPVMLFRNRAFENRAFITLNEGLGKVLRYGAFGDEVVLRLRWMEDVLARVLGELLRREGPIDVKSLIAQALQMGDEGHNRNRAGTSLLIREIAPAMFGLDEKPEDLREVLSFIHGNDHFFLNLSMGAAKCTVDAAADIEWSTLVSVMARNGTDFGVRLSGLGEQWFVAPSPAVEGLYLPGFSADDAARDIGDSVITETVGIGGFAMAAAPAITRFVGGSPKDALDTTRRMYSITTGENDAYQVPALDFRGTPTGIDCLKILRSGVLPAINTGIAHKTPGIGMVGAGLVKPPMRCFTEAAAAFVSKYSS